MLLLTWPGWMQALFASTGVRRSRRLAGRLPSALDGPVPITRGSVARVRAAQQKR